MARKITRVGITSLPSPTDDPIDLVKDLIENNRIQRPNELLVFNLATANAEGGALGRAMVFTGFDENGLMFGTDRNSRKYADILKNPNVAMTFLFVVEVSGSIVHQQIRVNGVALEASQSQINALWNKEPAFAKVRSIIHSQKPKTIEETRIKYEQMVNDFEEGKLEIPVPDNTTYFIVTPNIVDFYQSSANHVADRLIYQKSGERWTMHRSFG